MEKTVEVFKKQIDKTECKGFINQTVIYADVIMNIKVVVLSLEDVDRTEGRNDFDLYKKIEKHETRK